jgi:hypothetical protein
VKIHTVVVSNRKIGGIFTVVSFGQDFFVGPAKENKTNFLLD